MQLEGQVVPGLGEEVGVGQRSPDLQGLLNGGRCLPPSAQGVEPRGTDSPAQALLCLFFGGVKCGFECGERGAEQVW